jgi:putative PIN family toxin of toxin-antitoxin system
VKIVFDTNVILSSFLTEGIAHRIFNHCLLNHNIYISEFVISELSRILTKKFNVKANDLQEFLDFIKSTVICAIPENIIPKICRDKNDNQILQLAEYINADIIISGDKDLLVLRSYEETQIISPRDFFNEYLSNSSA